MNVQLCRALFELKADPTNEDKLRVCEYLIACNQIAFRASNNRHLRCWERPSWAIAQQMNEQEKLKAAKKRGGVA
jgi:hypothetical protein